MREIIRKSGKFPHRACSVHRTYSASFPLFPVMFIVGGEPQVRDDSCGNRK
jgi:hypothetical protein